MKIKKLPTKQYRLESKLGVEFHTLSIKINELIDAINQIQKNRKMKCYCEMCGKEIIGFCSKECSDLFHTLEKAHTRKRKKK